jgi:hypothetical protein
MFSVFYGASLSNDKVLCELTQRRAINQLLPTFHDFKVAEII